MHLKRLIQPILATIRVVIVLLLVVALCAAGADAARRGDAESKMAAKAKAIQVTEAAQVGPPSAPTTPGGSMAPNSRPTTEQCGVLSAVTAPSGNDRSLEKSNSESLHNACIDPTALPRIDAASARTLAQVAPLVAARCTLVGAVPSGTM